MPSENYLTRREQIGSKKRKKEANKPEKGNATGGRGRGRGRGRGKANSKDKSKGRGGKGRGRGGRGKVLKRPAAKSAAPTVEPNDNLKEEEEEEEPKEEDECVEEGAGSAPSGTNDGSNKRLRRATPLPEATAPVDGAEKSSALRMSEDARAAVASPKAKAKAKAKAQAKALPELVTEHDWEAELRQQLADCLKECQEAGEYDTTQKHTHRPAAPFDDYCQFSVYWSRKAVGIKVRTSVSDKWNQVAYFARDTPCVFTNYILANRWVPCF